MNSTMCTADTCQRSILINLMFLLTNCLLEMVNFCGIVGCGNRANREKDRSFHRIPGIVKHQGPETEERSRHRREKWLALINREYLTEEKLPFVRVCSDHFKSVYERVGTEANCHSNDGNEAAVEWAVQNEKQKNRDDKDKLTRKKRLKSRKERNKRRIKAMRMREAHSSGATAKHDSFQKDGQEIKIGRKPLDLRRPSAKAKMNYTKGEMQNYGLDGMPHYIKDRFNGNAQLRADFLDAVGIGYMNNGMPDTSDPLKEIPHCRYSAGISSLYQNQMPCSTCDRCSRSLSEASDEEGRYMNMMIRHGEHFSDLLNQADSNDYRNTVLDIARQITAYNNRLKTLPSKGRGLSVLTPRQLRNIWQRRMLSQGDNADYLRSQLKQLSFQRAFSSATGMGTQQGDWQEQASRTTDNQQFQISREPRSTSNTLQGSARVLNHFELKVSSDQKPPSRNPVTLQPVSENSIRGRARLPQLQTTEIYGNEAQSGQHIKSSTSDVQNSPRLNINPAASFPGYKINNKLPRKSSVPIKESSSDKQERQDQLRKEKISHLQWSIDARRVDVLKEKLRTCGGSGNLLNFALTSEDPKVSNTSTCSVDTSQQPINQLNSVQVKRDQASIQNVSERKVSVGRLSNGSKPQPVKLTATRTDLAGQTSHQARNQQINSTSDDSFGEVPTSESFTNRSVRTGNESFYSREKLRLSLQQQQHGSRNSLKGESSSGRDSEIIMQANGGKSLIDFNNQGFVTLNVNMNITPVIVENSSSSEGKQSLTKPPSMSDSLRESSGSLADTALQWVAEQLPISSGSSPSHATPISLKFRGKEAQAKQVNYSPRTKVNPPQLRRIGKSSK